MTDRFKQNRLHAATSPYLLQHKDNPVHWQPWEADVFAEARRRNVPVLLSVGYAACHWCHVMAHESFEDEAVATLMNENFVCIKLDREERPDLDEIYMSALSMMGEQGGWPLTMCLDADAKPFWGGTYFSKTPQYGRPGFMQILTEISRIWREAPDKIAKNTTALTGALIAQARADARGAMPADLPHRAATTLNAHMDKDKGGLAGAPKFPQPFLYQFLWQQNQLSPEAGLDDNIITTLTRIAQGGIYDHIGGGFARYSVDADWLVPHFEKMLYDNALLIDLFALVWRDTRDTLLETRISETVDWLLRDMCLDNGAFAASLDADTQGEEGKFYVWSPAEIEAVLGDDAAGFCAAYDITEAGNFEGHNIPHLLAAAADGPRHDLAAARQLLFAARDSRIRPGRDDKILADWNGMMIAALARTARLFNRDDWLAAARRAFDGACAALTDDNGQLCHSARHDAPHSRRLDLTLSSDLAFMGQAALALYEASGEALYLSKAEAYAQTLHNAFHDADNGAYLANRHTGDATLLVNQRPVQDNAMPSANAAIMAFFARLATATGVSAYRQHADDLFVSLAGHLAKAFPSMTALLAARQLADHPLSIIIIGQGANADALEEAACRHRIFGAFILRLGGSDILPPAHPAAGKSMVEGLATAYICPAESCLAPMTDAAALTTALDGLVAARQNSSHN